MAVRNKNELMEALRKRLGDSVEDDVISLVEDFNDTIDDYDSRLQQVGDWKQKYEENDAAWRQRYRDRFFQGDSPENFAGDVSDREIEEKTERARTYEDLFTETKREVK